MMPTILVVHLMVIKLMAWQIFLQLLKSTYVEVVYLADIKFGDVTKNRSMNI